MVSDGVAVKFIPMLFSAVDENVANIDFLRKDTKELFGRAKNKKSAMRSEDGGWTWTSIPEVEYDMALADVTKIIGVGV